MNMSEWGVLLTSIGGLISVVSVALGRVWGVSSSTNRTAQLDLHTGLTALVKEYQESRLFEAKKASAEEKKRKEAQDELNNLAKHVKILEGEIESLKTKVSNFTSLYSDLKDKYEKLLELSATKDRQIRDLEIANHKLQLELQTYKEKG